MIFQPIFASGFLDAVGERLLCTQAGQAFQVEIDTGVILEYSR
jgi:hypothetical protein